MERVRSDHKRRRRLVARCLTGSLLGVALATVGFVGTAVADQASDARAEFVDEANATTCAQVGDSSPSILSANGSDDASNADVSGTVTNNGTRDVLNVTVLNPGIQVNSVVVKGGNGYNLYHGNFQDMITPNNNGGQPAGFSHWFVCYGPGGPPPPDGDGGGGDGGGAATEVGAAGAARAVTASPTFTG
jgi:hypothetical protein